jgi:hypothetical protein
MYPHVSLGAAYMSTSEQPVLTGVWDGLFSYPRRFQPVSFTAVVLEIGCSVTGTIHEQPKDGPTAGLVLNATIDGNRAGSFVYFMKVYDLSEGERPCKPVHYNGVLNADATEIDGQWAIPGNWSGKFLMIRSSGPAAAAEARRMAAVPAR